MDIVSVFQDEKTSGDGQSYNNMNVLNTTELDTEKWLK